MKPKFGDLAKVVRTPPLLPAGVDVVGRVGVIEWLTHNDERAWFKLLMPEGVCDLAMFIPVECLELVDDPVWKTALPRFRRSERQSLIRYQQRLLKQQRIEEIADEYQMTVDAALKIAAVVTGRDMRHHYYQR